MYDIGERIKTLRRERGMTQERLAARLGVSGQAVSKWENRLTALAFLAEAYAGKGEADFTRATLARIPETYFTRLSLAAMYLQGEEKRAAAAAQRRISVELLVDMMRELAACYEEAGEADRARREREKARALIGLFAGEEEDAWVQALLRETE